MKTVRQVCQYLDALFPQGLAESWDNTGLLIGDRDRQITKVMACLTITPVSADEAIKHQAGLIVSHHPLPFRPLQRITNDTTVGKLLWQLITHSISVYSPHTRFDSATFGINEFIAERLNLKQIAPLAVVEPSTSQTMGSGRMGVLPAAQSWSDFSQAVRRAFSINQLRGVVAERSRVNKVAIACGSGGSLVEVAVERGCDVFVTGEMSFHSCLECQANGMGVILLGHFASERFGVERLVAKMQAEFGDLEIWASQDEADPISVF